MSVPRSKCNINLKWLQFNVNIVYPCPWISSPSRFNHSKIVSFYSIVVIALENRINSSSIGLHLSWVKVQSQFTVQNSNSCHISAPFYLDPWLINWISNANPKHWIDNRIEIEPILHWHQMSINNAHCETTHLVGSAPIVK